VRIRLRGGDHTETERRTGRDWRFSDLGGKIKGRMGGLSFDVRGREKGDRGETSATENQAERNEKEERQFEEGEKACQKIKPATIPV